MQKIIIVILLCITVIANAQNYKFGKVSKAELEEKFYPLDSTADATFLLKETKVRYGYSGTAGWSIITEVHERVKIYTKEGFSYATIKELLYNSSSTKERISNLKAYTFYLENGKVNKQKMSKKAVFKEKETKNWTTHKFTLPKIKEGVVLEYTYTKTSPFYFYIDDFILQEKIPVKTLNITFKAPEYFVFNKKIQGFLQVFVNESQQRRTISYSYRTQSGKLGQVSSTKRQAGSVDLSEKIYKINLSNIPSLKEEPFVSNINNYRSICSFELAFTKFPGELVKPRSNTWKSVAKSIYTSSQFGEELKKTNYFKNDIKELIATTKNDFEKIAAIFQFVKRKIKWNGNYGKYTSKGVKKAYKEGSGNVAEINLMLTSMLRFAGLNANPVLVSTRDNGVPLFPTLKGFNYVVTHIKFTDGSYAMLDATEFYSTPNLLPVRTLNWQGRKVLKDGTSSWVPLMNVSKPATEDYRISVKITEDLEVEGMMMTKLSNHAALSFRNKNNYLKEESVISTYEEKYNIEIANGAFKITNKLNSNKPISLRMKFTNEDLVEEISEKLYIAPLLFLSTKKNPFKQNIRKYPIDFATPWIEKVTVSMQIPKGYKVISAPKTTAVGLPNNIGVFKFIVKQTATKINIISIVQFNDPFIEAQQYSYLKEMFKTIVEKQNEKIILEKI